IDQNAELFTQKVAEECAKNDLPVISGGASGVDSIAMLSSLTQGGSAVGFLADSLYKKSLSAKFREHIASGRLVLLSPYHPKVGFSVGAAMGRNKLIYAQANQTLVVSSDFQKGGTWAGATEELKRAKHRPVLVRAEEKAPMGNHELIKLGGIPFSSISEQKNLATTEAISKPSTVVQDSLLAI
ncbi:MAG: DNA-processing protein DprA, partial [Desulfovibrio sp.]|nr:DNA-processing protein DprA [Desulfovibrio sp.]